MVLHSQPKNFALKHSTCEVFGLKDPKTRNSRADSGLDTDPHGKPNIYVKS